MSENKSQDPTPPDRSVEEAVEILDVQLEGLFNDAVRQVLRFIRKEQTELELKAELKSLSDFGLKGIRKKLTSLHTLGIEAGRRERDAQVQDVVRALDECIECCELVNGSDYCKNCGLAKEMYATLKHPNENET